MIRLTVLCDIEANAFLMSSCESTRLYDHVDAIYGSLRMCRFSSIGVKRFRCLVLMETRVGWKIGRKRSTFSSLYCRRRSNRDTKTLLGSFLRLRYLPSIGCPFEATIQDIKGQLAF